MKHFKIKEGKVRKIDSVSSPLGEHCLELVSFRSVSAETGERVHKIPCVTEYDFQNLIIPSVKATILLNIFEVDLFAAENIKKDQIKLQLFLPYIYIYKKKATSIFFSSPSSKNLAVQHLIKLSEKNQNKILPQA